MIGKVFNLMKLNNFVINISHFISSLAVKRTSLQVSVEKEGPQGLLFLRWEEPGTLTGKERRHE